MTPGRAAIVATAGESIARGSRSFALASRLFDRETRERVWLLYAWCRACDDLTDGQEAGHGGHAPADAETGLARIRLLTQAALEGQWIGDPPFDALRIVAQETRMPHGDIWDLVEGFALDAQGWRPQTEADMLRYCHHVAGVVGRMMAVVMGVDPRDEATMGAARDLGLSFQLANIARDLVDDGRAGRCYLPAEWLIEFGLPAHGYWQPGYRPRLAQAAQRLGTLAAALEASARAGAVRLPFRSRWAVLAAAGIYGDIPRLVLARGERAWDMRASTSAAAKLLWIARAAGQALDTD